MLTKGFLTSEFISMIVAQIIGVLVLLKVIPMEEAPGLNDSLTNLANALIQLGATAVTVFYMAKTLVAYIESRTILKRAAIGQKSPEMAFSTLSTTGAQTTTVTVPSDGTTTATSGYVAPADSGTPDTVVPQ